MPITINDCKYCGSVPVVYVSILDKWVIDCIIPDCDYNHPHPSSYERILDGKSFTDARTRWNELNPSKPIGMEAKDADND